MPGLDASGPRGMGPGAGWGRSMRRRVGRGGSRTAGPAPGPGSWPTGRGSTGARRDMAPKIKPFEPAGSPAPDSPDEVAPSKRTETFNSDCALEISQQ